MKKSLLLLFVLVIGGGLNTAEAQPLPVRVGYTALSGAFSPLWMAKELGLFERQGIQSTPIYMASNLAYQAMLAGETDFTVGTGIAPVQARLGGADPLIVVTYISGFNFSVIARPPIQQPGELRGKRIGVSRFGGGTDFGARLALKQWGSGSGQRCDDHPVRWVPGGLCGPQGRFCPGRHLGTTVFHRG
jgi:ABC-type nitrate/sulfonate/bicarbonate transport system substrate-binding protein